MEREDALIGLLGDELRRRLGDRYVVNQNFLSASLEREPSARPDLVVWPQDEPKRPYIVELKLISRDFDLPLSTASQMVRILRANQDFAPILILATSAHVGNLLRTELNAQNIEIVQSEEPSALVSDIAEIIETKQRHSLD